MRGEILSFDAVTGMGLISGDDGQRYNFHRSGFPGLGVPRQGQKVDFVASGDIATNIMGLGNGGPGDPATASSPAVAGPGVGAGIDWKHLFLSFEGRIRRSHFWIAWGILFVGGMVLGMIPILGGIIGLLLIWPNLAIYVKRLHDMDKTGWLVLVPIGLTLVLGVVAVMIAGVGAMSLGEYEDDPAALMAVMGPAAAVFLLIFLVQIGFLIWIGATPGTPGDNRYGPDPKGGVSVDTFS